MGDGQLRQVRRQCRRRRLDRRSPGRFGRRGSGRAAQSRPHRRAGGRRGWGAPGRSGGLERLTGHQPRLPAGLRAARGCARFRPMTPGYAYAAPADYNHLALRRRSMGLSALSLPRLVLSPSPAPTATEAARLDPHDQGGIWSGHAPGGVTHGFSRPSCPAWWRRCSGPNPRRRRWAYCGSHRTSRGRAIRPLRFPAPSSPWLLNVLLFQDLLARAPTAAAYVADRRQDGSGRGVRPRRASHHPLRPTDQPARCLPARRPFTRPPGARSATSWPGSTRWIGWA